MTTFNVGERRSVYWLLHAIAYSPHDPETRDQISFLRTTKAAADIHFLIPLAVLLIGIFPVELP
jgi:hypothetical protein